MRYTHNISSEKFPGSLKRIINPKTAIGISTINETTETIFADFSELKRIHSKE